MKGSAFGWGSKRFARLLSLVLVILMFCSLVPVGALAADDMEQPTGDSIAGLAAGAGAESDPTLEEVSYEPPAQEEPAPAQEEPAAEPEDPDPAPADPAEEPEDPADEDDDLPPDAGETPTGDNIVTIEDSEEKGEDKPSGTQSVTTMVELVSEDYRPPLHFEAKSNGLLVLVDAPEGAFPYGTSMRVAPVRDETILQTIGDEVGADASRVTAVDISFRHDGEEIEPEEYIYVTLKSDVIDEDTQIVHMDDYGYTQVVDQVANYVSDEVSFVSQNFSVYAVIGGEEPTARIQLTFHVISADGAEDTKVATIFVKKTDGADDLETIVYDPGIGELTEGETFRGWSKDNADFTVEDATSKYSDSNPTGAMSIEDIRTWVQSIQSSITEGSTLTNYDFYAMILKHYTVTYLDRVGVSLDTDSAYMLRSEDVSTYTIYKTYETNDENYHFKGWISDQDMADDDLITDPSPAPTSVTIKVETEPATDPPTFQDKTYNLYTNNTTITLAGDITFKAHAPKGKWLVFHEVMKGATYTAPQFLEENEEPDMPDESKLLLLGYRFAGWYKTYSETVDPVTGDVTSRTYSDPYTPGPINDHTHIYAKWEEATLAPYTVIIWKENLDGTYSYSESFKLGGTVDANIESLNHLAIVTNGSSNYLNVTGQQVNEAGTALTAYNRNFKFSHSQTGGGTNANPYVHHYLYDNTQNHPNPGADSPYLGFCCTEIEYQDEKINPEGNSVVNVYYDRITYTVRTYYIRRSGNNYYHATYRSNTSNARPELVIGNGGDGMNWGNSFTYNAGNFPSNMQWEKRGNEYYSYVDITARYGEDISAQWPKYEDLKDLGNYHFTSWYTMNSAGFYKGAGSGLDSFKGIITIMDAQILGDVISASPATNYLIGRYDNNVATYTYEIWRETVDGEDYSAYETKTVGTGENAKTYYHDENEDIFSRSSAKPSGAHAPTYRGFDYQENMDVRPADPAGNGQYGQHYTLEFYYNRVANPIIYRDGAYFNGNGVYLGAYPATGQDVESDPIPFETDITEYNGGYAADGTYSAGEYYKTDYPSSYDGFVFEGWYTDSTCTTPYEFTTMPDTSITVYAKFRQVQYRVFLVPNVPEGKHVYWGSDDQEMNFRKSYHEFISTPTGKLVFDEDDPDTLDDSYEFDGWYLDAAYKRPFDGEAVALDDSIAIPYDKTVDLTDEMNRYGEITGGGPSGNGWNSDLIDKDNNWAARDRWWIDKKIVLYGKWIPKSEAGTGIQIRYDPNGGTINDSTDVYVDTTLYKSGTNAAAQGAPVAPVYTQGDETKSKIFLYWVLQKWDESKGKYVDVKPLDFAYPGDNFPVSFDKAHEVVTTDPETGNVINTEYFIQLRAEYKDPEAETPTHIWWYANFGDNDVVTTNTIDDPDNPGSTITGVEEIGINQAAYIKPANTFTHPKGYKFLGWARVESTDGQGNPISGHPALHPELGENNLFLKYDEATGTFLAKNASQAWVTVDQVAADEDYPYHDLYAVWEPLYEVTVAKVVQGTMGDVNKEFTIKVTASKDITYNNATVTAGTEITLTLKNGDTPVSFSDIPGDTVFTLVENDYTGDNGGYSLPVYTYDPENADAQTLTPNNRVAAFTITDDGTIVVTNTKDIVPDTGISMEALPFFLILGLTMFSSGAMLLSYSRRRRSGR